MTLSIKVNLSILKPYPSSTLYTVLLSITVSTVSLSDLKLTKHFMEQQETQRRREIEGHLPIGVPTP